MGITKALLNLRMFFSIDSFSRHPVKIKYNARVCTKNATEQSNQTLKTKISQDLFIALIHPSRGVYNSISPPWGGKEIKGHKRGEGKEKGRKWEGKGKGRKGEGKKGRRRGKELKKIGGERIKNMELYTPLIFSKDPQLIVSCPINNVSHKSFVDQVLLCYFIFIGHFCTKVH